jgi:hypothetical protein
MSPQDYSELAEEFDLLNVEEAVLHDPDSAADDVTHLEQVLSGAVVWIPGAVPYGNLWRDLRVGVPPQPVKLCASCFPPNG